MRLGSNKNKKEETKNMKVEIKKHFTFERIGSPLTKFRNTGRGNLFQKGNDHISFKPVYFEMTTGHPSGNAHLSTVQLSDQGSD